MKKFIVLGVLFLLPITVYMFFATGVNNFVKLPTLTENVSEIDNLKTVRGEPVQLEGRITVLQFMGNNVEGNRANAFNLAHKIYKKNFQFEEFQFVTLITLDQKEKALQLKEKIAEIENPKSWKFVVATPQQLKQSFASLQTESMLTPMLDSELVYIIDKKGNLRGRTDDEDYGKMYGYNAADYAEINNKMSDDIKVVLAEYRLALKKYKAEREI